MGGNLEFLDVIGKRIRLIGHESPVADESKTPVLKSRVDLRPDSGAATELKSKKGAFPLKTFQFEFAKRTRRNESFQLRVRGLTQAARLA